MRVLHFVHRLPPDYSGAAFQALRLIEAMQTKAGSFLQSGVLSYARDPHRALAVEGCETHVVRLRRGPFGKLRQYGQLRRSLRSFRPDVLHIHGYHRPLVHFAQSAGIPVVLKTTMLGVDDARTIHAKGALDASLLSKVEILISMTPALEEANRGYPNLRIPNGVDLQRFRPGRSKAAQEHRASLGLRKEDLLFLFVGGDSPRKGFDELPELWRKISTRFGDRAHLLVSGRFQGAPLWPHQASPNVHLRAELLDLSEWLPAGDCLLFLSHQEGLPNVVLEAAACDTFVLARSLPDTFDGILDQRNSMVFEQPNQELIEGLARVLQQDGHRSVCNEDFRSRFALPVIASRYLRLYEELASSRQLDYAASSREDAA